MTQVSPERKTNVERRECLLVAAAFLLPLIAYIPIALGIRWMLIHPQFGAKTPAWSALFPKGSPSLLLPAILAAPIVLAYAAVASRFIRLGLFGPTGSRTTYHQAADTSNKHMGSISFSLSLIVALLLILVINQGHTATKTHATSAPERTVAVPPGRKLTIHPIAPASVDKPQD